MRTFIVLDSGNTSIDAADIQYVEFNQANTSAHVYLRNREPGQAPIKFTDKEAVEFMIAWKFFLADTTQVVVYEEAP